MVWVCWICHHLILDYSGKLHFSMVPSTIHIVETQRRVNIFLTLLYKSLVHTLLETEYTWEAQLHSLVKAMLSWQKEEVKLKWNTYHEFKATTRQNICILSSFFVLHLRNFVWVQKENFGHLLRASGCLAAACRSSRSSDICEMTGSLPHPLCPASKYYRNFCHKHDVVRLYAHWFAGHLYSAIISVWEIL